MVLRQHSPMGVEETVVVGKGAGPRRRRRHGSWRRRMHWRTRWWVEVTNPIPQVKGQSLAHELVNDGDDATLGMHKGTESEDVFAKDGSLPDPACKVQIKGLNINWVCTVSRRLAGEKPRKNMWLHHLPSLVRHQLQYSILLHPHLPLPVNAKRSE